MHASPLAPAKMSFTKRCMRVPQAKRMIAKMSPVFRPYHKKSWKLWSRRITPTWRSPLMKISMSKKTRAQQCFTKSKTHPSSMKKMLSQTQIALTQAIAHRLTRSTTSNQAVIIITLSSTRATKCEVPHLSSQLRAPLTIPWSPTLTQIHPKQKVRLQLMCHHMKRLIQRSLKTGLT